MQWMPLQAHCLLNFPSVWNLVFFVSLQLVTAGYIGKTGFWHFSALFGLFVAQLILASSHMYVLGWCDFLAGLPPFPFFGSEL